MASGASGSRRVVPSRATMPLLERDASVLIVIDAQPGFSGADDASARAARWSGLGRLRPRVAESSPGPPDPEVSGPPPRLQVFTRGPGEAWKRPAAGAAADTATGRRGPVTLGHRILAQTRRDRRLARVP